MPPPSAPHHAVRPEWLALQSEPTLDPGIPIVDAHHHLWQFPDKSYRACDLAADMAQGHRFASTVFVECKTHYLADGPEALRSAGEMAFVNGEREWAQRAGAAVDIAAASVGYADLQLGERVGEVLDALTTASGRRLRSVRNIAVWHADSSVRASAATPPGNLMSRSDFREGFAVLPSRGLAFDAWLVHTQLDELHALTNAFPAVQVVLNHLGGPLALGPYASQRAAVFAAWREGMARLAALPNIAVKIGGFGMPLFGFDFAARPVPPDSTDVAQAIRPYVTACIDLFGAERCMFESNFPVDKGSFNYHTVWNAYKRLVSGRPEREIELLFSGTATRIYGLTLADR